MRIRQSVEFRQDSESPPQFSIFQLFTIGIGPSSSHTVGPMRAAADFAARAMDAGDVTSVQCELFGSLALTGKGHGTDTAVMLGLAGWQPELVDPQRVPAMVENVRATETLLLHGVRPIAFHERDIVFRMGEFLPGHANALRFTAVLAGAPEITQTYFSIGGGAILAEGQQASCANVALAFPFSSATELLAHGRASELSIAEMVWANEEAWRSKEETANFLDAVHAAMMASIDHGLHGSGVLPGGLNVRRRAKSLHEKLLARGPRTDPSHIFEWVSLYALAVNEENAAGGRIVTAPTNGAAGILPAVLKYYQVFTSNPSRAGVHNFLMTAAAIGFLYKLRASISAAEMGCQGEIGVACSMAAAGLVAALGGSNEQAENAAEIGMEHNLGLTCDPVGGLVQIPCIERNTMGTVKAINAAYLALQGDGRHVVSLDAVIETMRQTGKDMASKYKETSLGGLAVNVVEC